MLSGASLPHSLWPPPSLPTSFYFFSFVLVPGFPHQAKDFRKREVTLSMGLPQHGTRGPHPAGPKATYLRDWDRPQLYINILFISKFIASYDLIDEP